MISRKIMNELKKKKGLSTIYNLIGKIRKESGYKLTKADAAHVLAGDLGIDIAKHLSDEELEKLRNVSTQIKIIETKNKKLNSKTVDLKIQDITIKIPFLKNTTTQDCKKMLETYKLFYLLENSIRFFILSTLESEYPSEDWWNKDGVVPKEIKKNVRSRMKKENKNRWHAKRGGHYIHYTDFGNLKDIIRQNRRVFGRFFPDQHWIISRLQDLELSRNIIAHTNPLPPDEVGRIKLYFRDWTKQIKR